MDNLTRSQRRRINCQKGLPVNYGLDDTPTRCIDPVVKYCQGCQYGHCIYPEWVETAEDLEGCTFETVCIYGFDKGRPEDEPTKEELAEFDKWVKDTEELHKQYCAEEDWLK